MTKDTTQKTLRDEFAMAALPLVLRCEPLKGAVEIAYKIADAMMKERER